MPFTQHSRPPCYKTLYDTNQVMGQRKYNNCTNTLCFTYSKGTYIYKPHSVKGLIGRTASGYLHQRNRI